ncbi:unnamed protein product [Sphagnum balticum]
MSGIDTLLPKGTVVDSHLFDPCGYSMNGIIEGTDRYVTIHITPEPAFSYVSFETNQDQKCLFEQTVRVLKCFRGLQFLLLPEHTLVYAHYTAVQGDDCSDSGLSDVSL